MSMEVGAVLAVGAVEAMEGLLQCVAMDEGVVGVVFLQLFFEGGS